MEGETTLTIEVSDARDDTKRLPYLLACRFMLSWLQVPQKT